MGPQKKYKNEQISVRHFSGKRAMGAKKTEMFQKIFVGLSVFYLWPPTEMRPFPSVARKNTDLHKNSGTFPFFCFHSAFPTKMTYYYGNLFVFVFFLWSHSGWPY